jgi:preprotein translocase subunit SecA
VQTASAWLDDKFGIKIAHTSDTLANPKQFIEAAHLQAIEAYDQREAQYPVLASLYRFTQSQGGGLDREGLVAWANARLGANITLDDLKNKQRDEIAQLLVKASHKASQRAGEMSVEAQRKVEKLFDGEANPQATLGKVTGANGKLDDLTSWLRENCESELTSEELAKLDRQTALRRVSQEVEYRFRPEMRRMERALLLQLLDTAWKEHLLAMDHLRSSVGLRGYAQVDPKVEYKREGMKMFERMWESVGAYVTDLVFKLEHLDERFVKSTWTETKAIHEEVPSDIGQQQQAAIDASGGGGTAVKLEPIRNRTEKVGRNDPCPCGSGKKYKQCCLNNG